MRATPAPALLPEQSNDQSELRNKLVANAARAVTNKGQRNGRERIAAMAFLDNKVRALPDQ